MSSSFNEEMEPPEMETLAALAENLVYRLPGCSDLMVRKTLQEVYRDFCRRSCCLRVRRHFTLGNGDRSVVFSPMYGGIIDCIAGVGEEHRTFICGRDYTSEGCRITFPNHIVPLEGDTRVIWAFGIEIPRINSENAPSWFIQRHGESVIAGSLSRLQRMTGKPWSDPTEAQMNLLAYESAISEERTRYIAGNDAGRIEFGFCTDDLI